MKQLKLWWLQQTTFTRICAWWTFLFGLHMFALAAGIKVSLPIPVEIIMIFGLSAFLAWFRVVGFKKIPMRIRYTGLLILTVGNTISDFANPASSVFLKILELVLIFALVFYLFVLPRQLTDDE